MQQIRIQSFKWPDHESAYIADKKYRVFVDGKPMHFTNRKHVKAWLAETNRFLNTNMLSLNRLLVEVYGEYRNYYFHLDTVERQRYMNSFAMIDKSFALTLSRSSFQSGLSLSLEFLRKICRYLLEIVDRLERHPMNRLATVQRHRLKCLQSAISAVEMQLNELPPEKEK
jgi:hypothetical protein